MKEHETGKSDIAATLGIHSSKKGHRRMKWFLALVLTAALAATAVFIMNKRAVSSVIRYKTVDAVRGNISVTVTATGNLEPTNQVDVGSELSGTVRAVEVNDNDQVKKGQVLAVLDTTKLMAQNRQYKAALKSAQAKVLQAKATVREAEGNLNRLKQVRKLSGNKIPSQYELDTAEATLDRARAEQTGAEASVAQARATLQTNETDLSKAVIRSPINGVVLIRDVEPGQTVAASLQAPVLFTLAEDLTQMELHVDVDEADVGQVRAGQKATFTVDAYPDRSFPARISKVRYGSETTDGVVTYETILKVENGDLLLRPGMTATAEITVKDVQGAVLIPNAALRFAPPAKVKPASSDSRGLVRRLLPGPPRRHRASKKKTDQPLSPDARQHVWTLSGGQLKSIQLRTGATDGTMTEVIGDGITSGTSLVVDTEGQGS